MKDKWINAGYEGDELKPHTEPVADYSDASRIGQYSHFHYFSLILLISKNEAKGTVSRRGGVRAHHLTICASGPEDLFLMAVCLSVFLQR